MAPSVWAIYTKQFFLSMQIDPQGQIHGLALYSPTVTDMFYNTGISTHVWIVSNRKPEHRKGKVQLIDASAMWQKIRKSLGSKRKELSEEHIAEITCLFGQFREAETHGKPVSRNFRNTDFGYRTITVERPERDEQGRIVLGQQGNMKGKP